MSAIGQKRTLGNQQATGSARSLYRPGGGCKRLIYDGTFVVICVHRLVTFPELSSYSIVLVAVPALSGSGTVIVCT